MVIRELKINSFGKFKNKEIEFKDGFNLVYGENESGKTTVHKFIEGMLFGFFKPYSKKKIYTADQKKYIPWTKEGYNGIIKYSYNNNMYRVERNFLKKQDEVKIFDDITGEDITDFFEYDPVLRQHIPILPEMNINSIIYKNTVSISQMNSKIECSLSKEVKNSLINVGKSLSEDISIKKVTDFFNNEIDNIGTKERKKTSPYGKAVEELDALYKEKDKTVKELEIVNDFLWRLQGTEEEIKRLKTDKENAEIEVEKIKKLQLIKKYKDASLLKNSIENMETQIEKLKKYEDLNFDEYGEIVSLTGEVYNFKEKVDNLKNEIEEKNIQIREVERKILKLKEFEDMDENKIKNIVSSLQDFYINNKKLKELNEKIKGKAEQNIYNTGEYENISDDLYKYEELEEKKNKILYDQDYSKSLFLKVRLEEKEKLIKKSNLFFILLMVALFSFIGMGFINKFLFIGIIPIFLFIIYIISRKKEIEDYVVNLKGQINEINNKEENKEGEIRKIENELKNILSKYDLKSKIELKKLLNSNYERDLNLKSEEKSLKDIKDEIIELNNVVKKLREDCNDYFIKFSLDENCSLNDIKNIEINYADYRNLLDKHRNYMEENNKLKGKYNFSIEETERVSKNIRKLLNKNKCSSLEEFKEGLNKKNEYKSLKDKLENDNILLNNILNENNFERLKDQVGSFKEDVDYFHNEENKDDLMDRIKKLDTRISKLYIDKTVFESNIKNAYSGIRPLVEIIEDIERKKNVIDYYENKIKSLVLARDTIDNISKNIHKEFAPLLNERISSLIRMITDERYKEVKISENMDVSVEDPETGMLVNIEQLSGGTMDQLYFATRFEIMDTMEEEKIPLILDDSFVQYDYNRLKNILKFLSKDVSGRQIILFTCHIREREILDELGVKYNYINLS